MRMRDVEHTCGLVVVALAVAGVILVAWLVTR